MESYNIIAEQENITVMSHYEALPREDNGYQSEAALEEAFIHQLTQQGYERVNITSEPELISNLRKQMERLNGISLSDAEWKQLFEQRIVSILDQFEASIQNLEEQLSQRQKQYEYYRNKLLTFN